MPSSVQEIEVGMVESLRLAGKTRAERGSRAAGRLRRSGRVPAIVYGHKIEPVALTIADDDLRAVIRHNVRVVDLEHDGKREKCLIKEIQWDALGRDILHVDFTRVSEDERIRVTVPIQLRGTAPGTAAGGIINQPMHTIDIECLAIAVPESIRVSIAELQIDQAIHLKDVKLPEGVKAFGDPEAIVVQMAKPEEEAAAAEAEAAGPAEPEVIGRKAAEEEEADAEK